MEENILNIQNFMKNASKVKFLVYFFRFVLVISLNGGKLGIQTVLKIHLFVLQLLSLSLSLSLCLCHTDTHTQKEKYEFKFRSLVKKFLGWNII